MRTAGSTEDGKRVISGLDVFKFISSQGFDLEVLLGFLDSKNCVVDWLEFSKAATLEGWLMRNLLKKIMYPITEVYGERYWLAVRSQIALWFIEYMK